MRGPSVVFERVDEPCPRPLHFSHIAYCDYGFCSLPDSDVGTFMRVCCNVMLNILLSFLVCPTASFFCACLASVHAVASYVIAGSTYELYTCLFTQMVCF